MEIYDSTFESNTAGYVSNSKYVPRIFLEIFARIPGGGHATSRAELLVLGMLPL
jgi:hypothetical protein